jgi:glycosyltransferase involved in cell wall biosynthesis
MKIKGLRIAYLCIQGGPHLAHKPWVDSLLGYLDAEVIYIPRNTLCRLLPSYILTGKKFDLAIADGFSALPIGWLMKKIGLCRRLAFITTSTAIIDFPKLSSTLLKSVDLVIATSSLMSSVIKSSFNFSGHVFICHPVPDLSDFLKINPSLKSNRICFVGSHSYIKGVDLLPEIITRIRRKIKDVEIYVIGKGKMVNESDGIKVFGYVPHDKRLLLLSECSVYLHPSRFEAFGLSVVEAMAAGLIPIVTEMTGSKDLVKKVNPSLVVPVDVNAISEKAVEVLEMRIDEKEALSRRAKQVALEWGAKTKETFLKGIIKALRVHDRNTLSTNKMQRG